MYEYTLGAKLSNINKNEEYKRIIKKNKKDTFNILKLTKKSTVMKATSTTKLRAKKIRNKTNR